MPARIRSEAWSCLRPGGRPRTVIGARVRLSVYDCLPITSGDLGGSPQAYCQSSGQVGGPLFTCPRAQVLGSPRLRPMGGPPVTQAASSRVKEGLEHSSPGL